MKFYPTQHAIQRMRARGIEPPDFYKMTMKPAGKKMRRQIRESCKLTGTQNDKIYWVRRQHQDGKKILTVYVCIQTGIAEYTVITAFKYE